MKRKQQQLVFAAVLVLIAIFVWRMRSHHIVGVVRVGVQDDLALLLPDDADLKDPRITVWLDAGREQGLHLRPVKASAFLRSKDHSALAGIVLPDKVHQAMSDGLVQALREYVNHGGTLMQTFDAGTWTASKFYAHDKSRLSDLAGVDYAMYEEMRADFVSMGAVHSTPDVLANMDIPPGKFMHNKSSEAAGANAVTLVGYKREFLSYPYFVTRGNFGGTTLMTSPKGLVAGVNNYGSGKVLFVNLPLGYLAGRTDGVMLHSYLKYFSEHVLSLPRLAAVPEGKGGMVMNWHVDSNADIKYVLDKMKALGIYDQGPYSIHITAGPDTRKPGDKLGVNVPKDQRMRAWLRSDVAHGNEVGSHGGWIHDYFGWRLSYKQTPEFENYLKWNKEALENATGRKVTEYSAPQGNQPQWVTRWLAARGILGYYFTGDTGMAPTRNYRNGKPELPNNHMWAFPVTNFGMSGSFEEINESGTPEKDVEKWLRDLVKFAANDHVSRLVYFHPNGTRFYPNAMRGWLAEAKKEASNGHFQWYTMTGLATFLNSREKVKWNVKGQADGSRVFTVTHPQDLNRQAVLLPIATYAEPKITAGKGSVRKGDAYWIVSAGPGKSLSFASLPM